MDIKALKDDLWASVDRINPANKAPPKGKAAPKTVPVEFMGEKKEALPFSVPLARLASPPPPRPVRVCVCVCVCNIAMYVCMPLCHNTRSAHSTSKSVS